MTANKIAARQENICGDLPNLHEFYNHIRNIGVYDYKFIEIYRISRHIRSTLMDKYDITKDNFDLRVSYLINEFDENTWITKLMNREKKKMKNNR